MRIVAIRGRDLASLKGPFAIELDQPPLSTLGLFAIHGPVGAGKSTLLDAMTLGLFGRTPRLSGVGGAPLLRGDDDIDQLKSNDPSTLVRRGADGAHAEVDFIGVDGRLYRARWDVRRGRAIKGRPGRLQADKHTLRDVLADVALGDGNTEVRRIIQERLGLSFDELCRSVLLAQGGFQSFLQAKPAERAALLEKVTGTEIYSRLGVAAHERARGVESALQALDQQVLMCAVLPDDDRQAMERQVVLQGSAAAAADGTVASLTTALERAQVRRDCGEARGLLLAAERTRTQTEAAVIDARARVDAARRALDVARPVLEASRRTREAARPILRALDDARATSRSAAHDADVARTRQLRAREATAAADLEVTRLLAEVQRLEGDRADVDPDRARVALLALAAALMEQAGARAVIDAAARQVDDAAAACTVAAAAADDADDAVARALPAGVTVGSRDAVVAAITDALQHADAMRLASLDSELAGATAMVERLEAALARQASDAALAAARHTLHDGEPCPVCGSETHPWAPAPTSKPGRSAPADPVVQAIGDERQRLKVLQAERSACGERLSATLARRKRLRVTPASLPAGAPTTVPALLALLQAIDDADDAVAAAAAARSTSDDARDVLEGARAAHGVQVAHGEARASAVVGATATCVTLGLIPGATDAPDLDPAALRRRADDLAARAAALHAARQRSDAADDARLAASQASQQADAAVHGADAVMATALAVLAERQGAAAVAEADVDAANAAVVAADLVGVDVGTLQRTLDEQIATVARHEAAHSAACDAASVALARLRERTDRLERLGGTSDGTGSIGPDDDGPVLVALAQARQQAIEARDAVALARARLAHDDVQRAKRQGLEQEVGALRERGRVWLALSQLIGAADGAKFRQFAQGLTLDALIGHANEQLRVLAPRYRLRRTQSLQQKHDLDLVVIDTEAGDDVRSTATLSGGEGFLVSLALALGLSSLSANEGARGRVESLFIDEGFSALDQETLDVALAAFDALRQTGRQIGVISHVPLLVERLGAQVRVVPIGGGASRVEVHAS